MIVVILLFLFEGLVCSALGLNTASSDTLITISHFLIIINSTALFAYITMRYREYDRSVLYALLASLILKVALLLWDYYATGIFILPNSHADSEGYHRGAILFATNSSFRVENYSYLIGLIYRYFGVQRLTAQYSNIIFSFLGIDILARTLEILDIDERAKKITMIFAALMPNYLIMSAILIRECLISVLLCFALYFFARWWKRSRFIDLIIAGLIPLAACWLHSGAIAGSIGVAICSVISKPKENGDRYLRVGLSGIIMSAVFFVGFMYLFNTLSGSLLKRFQGLEISAIDSYASGHNFYTEIESSSSSYAAGIAGSTGWRGILINSPIRVIYFLWVPMPWDIRGLGDIIAFIGSSMFYGGLVFTTLYQLLTRKLGAETKPLVIAMLVISLCGALVFAWGVDSAGSALRHREKFYFIFLVLFAALLNDIYHRPVLEGGSMYEKTV